MLINALQILSFTGDNASSNDTQTDTLSNNPSNSFDSINRVRCLNHTLQLSAKAILKLFTKDDDTDKADGDAALDVAFDDIEDLPELEDPSDSEGDEEEDGDEDPDELLDINEADKERLIQDTTDVRFTLTKVP